MDENAEETHNGQRRPGAARRQRMSPAQPHNDQQQSCSQGKSSEDERGRGDFTQRSFSGNKRNAPENNRGKSGKACWELGFQWAGQ